MAETKGRRYRLAVVAVCAVAAVAVSWWYITDVKGQFECVARYNTALQERSQILTRIAAEDRQQSIAAERNITRLITDVIAGGGDRGKGEAAARRYLETSSEIARKRGELESQRNAQPFPQTPERACT